MSFNNYKNDAILIAHFLLGIVAAFNQVFVFIWVLSAFILGVYAAYTKSVRYSPYLFAGYLVGIELLGRMSSAGLPHEFIKYAVSVILIISMVRSGRRNSYAFIFYILLLLPATFLTDGGSIEGTRQFISANLSGPLCLAISVLYFYDRPFNEKGIRRLLISVLYPLAAILGYLMIKTPDFTEIEFGYNSNFATSIYGPNQMSSILGLGILIMGLTYFLKIRTFGSNILMLGFTSFLLLRGLLTFSRGGMLAPAILLIVVLIYYSSKAAGFNKITIRILFFSILFSLLSALLFQYADNITGNKLFDRYTGRRGGEQIEDIDKLTSGRTMIVILDWKIFLDHPILGSGVGMANSLRSKAGYYSAVSAHNEFSRILAEHGLLGVIALFILIVTPLNRFFKSKIAERTFIIAFVGFCFVFMTHSATRIAAPCFLYGFAFIKILSNKRVLKENVTLSRQQTFKAREGGLSNRTVSA